MAPNFGTEAILEGRQPTELTAKRLIRSALKIPCFGMISAHF
jgi:hypothetical protein